MWRLIACFALAAGEFTTKQLDEMSSSLKTKADEYQSQVVALGKELGNLSAKITMIPMEFAKAKGEKDPDAAIETLKEGTKATIDKLCAKYDALKKVSEEVGKDATNAKDAATQVQTQMTEMAKDVANLKDGQTLQFYLGKFHSAITTLDSASASAGTFLTAGNAICTPENEENMLNQLSPSPSRLFLATKPALPQDRSFHPSSALMGAVFGATVVGAVAVAFSRSKHQTALIDQSMEWAGEWYRPKAKLFFWGRNLPMSLFPTAHMRRALQKKQMVDVHFRYILQVLLAFLCFCHARFVQNVLMQCFFLSFF